MSQKFGGPPRVLATSRGQVGTAVPEGPGVLVRVGCRARGRLAGGVPGVGEQVACEDAMGAFQPGDQSA